MELEKILIVKDLITQHIKNKEDKQFAEYLAMESKLFRKTESAIEKSREIPSVYADQHMY